MEYLVIGLSVLIGLIFGVIVSRLRKDGYLRIDTSDPGKDSYLMDIHTSLEKLPDQKYLILRIDSKYHKPLENSAINGKGY